MKKIGIFWSLTSYGGVQTCVMSLIKGLNEIGVIPDLITDQKVNIKILEESKLRLNPLYVRYSVSYKKSLFVNKYIGGITDFVYFYKLSWLRKRYDFIYLFSYNVIVDIECDYLYYLSMSPRAIGYSGNILTQKLKYAIYDYIIRYFLPVYDIHGNIKKNYVINSYYTSEWFYKNYEKKIDVIYPSNTLMENNNVRYIQKDKKDIVFLSRISPGKRVELFVDLCEHFPLESFVIIGSSDDALYLDKIKRMIYDKGIKNLCLKINLKNEDVKKQLFISKIYVFTAKNEHFGITTVEAMMSGAIPFVHNSGGQVEIVPWEELRFDDENYLIKFKDLLDIDEAKKNEILENIKKHIRLFDEKVFISKMLSYLKLADSNLNT